MKEGVQAILFDLDGVLVDASDWHFEALRRALQTIGCKLDYLEHKSKFEGLPTVVKLDLLASENRIDRTKIEIIELRKQEFTTSIIEKNCIPNPQIIQCLRDLKHHDYKLGVVTNATSQSRDLMLKKSQIIDFFDIIVSPEDVGVSKPNPAIYNRAINSLGVSPKNVIIVEDNINGIMAALGAGANVLEVKSPTDVSRQAVFSKIREINDNLRKGDLGCD